MTKEDLIRAYQEMEEKYEIDELNECNVENMKLEYHENLVLLEALLKEITSQIENNTPNLLKIRGMINEC